MADDPSTILCRTPTPGKRGARIARWRFERMRQLLLECLPADDLGIELRALHVQIKQRLPAEERKLLGSIAWYATRVRLDLEVSGEVERVPDSRPYRVRRGSWRALEAKPVMMR